MSSATVTAKSTGQTKSDFRSIERRNAAELPYQTFLNEYVVKNRPVIIENSVPHWRALDEWTPDFFRKNFGDKVVNVTYNLTMRFADLMDAVEASTAERPGPYLHQLIIYHHMPELLPYLTPENPYGYPGRFTSPLMIKANRRPDGYLKLLVGGVGGKFPFMHFDSANSNALITEIYGDKEFLFFAPEDSKYLYPKKDTTNVSQIDNPDNPDLTKFPLFPNATPYRGVVSPGDTILVPSAWWHAAKALTTSFSVCTNMLHRSSWPGHIRWSCRPVAGRSWAYRTVGGMYLTGLGMALSSIERLQEIAPNSALARKLAYLAPLKREDVRGRVLPSSAPESAY